jgi:hypothetical protein
MEERILKKQIFDQKMEELVLKFSNYKDLKKPLKYIENGLGELYKYKKINSGISPELLKSFILW